MNWSTGIAPDGWTINFANPPAKVDVLKEANVVLAILPPNQTDAGFGFDLPIYVEASNNERYITGVLTLQIEVPSSDFAGISTDTEAASVVYSTWRVG